MQENFFDVNNNQNLNFQFNNNYDQTKDNIKLLIKREVKEIFHYQKLIKKNNLLEKKDFYELEIIILKDYIQTEQDISLLIIIPFNYPKYEPEIYCLTEFCHPHLCDGRNLLFDIIKDKWQRDVHNLEFIINKLPGFFVSFLEARKKKGNYIAGSFILNKYYNINRLKDLPIFFHLITHKEKKITLYKIKSHKIITISEISFCMFELDNNHTGYCKLVFFADLKDLIGIQLDTKNNEIEIKFKNLLKDKKHTKIEIISSNSENINRILLENQKKFLSYNNNYNHNNSIIDNGKKELSEEEKKIMMIEKQILYVEKSITVGDKPKKGQIKYLINLYKNAIEYYSSKNNQEKCDDYKSKINMFEPELDKYKKENNTKQNILIEDENTNIENINFNIKPSLNIDNQNLIKVVQKEEVTKINNINNIFVNNDIFNLNNISNNSSNSNTNNDIFNFIQPLSQSNNNTNNNNLFDFGFDFTM
jgi:ubiquitin-protein ligase